MSPNFYSFIQAVSRLVFDYLFIYHHPFQKKKNKMKSGTEMTMKR